MADYEPGEEFQCLSIPIQIIKQPETASPSNYEGSDNPNQQNQNLISGFSIIGGIDQDLSKLVQRFSKNGIYVTHVAPNSPAAKAGLMPGDRILQCNGRDFTLVTHKKAADYIRKYPILNLLITREDDCVNV